MSNKTVKDPEIAGILTKMGLVEKISKCLLPLAAAGLIGCSSVSGKHALNGLEFGLRPNVTFAEHVKLDKTPSALKEEAANPYMVFNDERIDTATNPSLSAYSPPSLPAPTGSLNLGINAKYWGFFVQPRFTFLFNKREYLECQAPQPNVPTSYYDIRYAISSDALAFPISLRVGFEPSIKISPFLEMAPRVNFDYTQFSYRIYQGIESYSVYNLERTIAKGNGNLYSFGIGLTFQSDKRDRSKPRTRFGGEFGLGISYQFGDVKFSNMRSRFDAFAFEIEGGFRIF